MAYATPSTPLHHTGLGLRAALRGLFARLAEARARDHAYRRTYRELDQMSDRDLADIGITRFMIGDIAAEAAARV
jgi:uncharacterized protein YjiS (DUF1127 family)